MDGVSTFDMLACRLAVPPADLRRLEDESRTLCGGSVRFVGQPETGLEEINGGLRDAAFGPASLGICRRQ